MTVTQKQFNDWVEDRAHHWLAVHGFAYYARLDCQQCGGVGRLGWRKPCPCAWTKALEQAMGEANVMPGELDDLVNGAS